MKYLDRTALKQYALGAVVGIVLGAFGTASANHSEACGNDGPNGGYTVIVGTNHDDCLRGGNGPDRIKGRRGDDRLGGNHGPDRVLGGPGDDRVHGGRGPDYLNGGPGYDICSVDANDVVRKCERIKDPGRN